MEKHNINHNNFPSVIPADIARAISNRAKAGIQVLSGKGKKGLDSRFRGNDKQDQKPIKKVMVFGVFDRLHPGHISLLEQAAGLGDELIAVVARDFVVEKLKKKLPHQSEEMRQAFIKRIPFVTHAALGDVELSSYKIVQLHQPDIICLGYDQQALAEDIKSCMSCGELPLIEVVMMEPYGAERFHTSLLL